MDLAGDHPGVAVKGEYLMLFVFIYLAFIIVQSVSITSPLCNINCQGSRVTSLFLFVIICIDMYLAPFLICHYLAPDLARDSPVVQVQGECIVLLSILLLYYRNTIIAILLLLFITYTRYHQYWKYPTPS